MGRALHGGPFLPAVAQAVPALLTRSHHALVSGLLTDLVAGAAVVVPAYSSWYAADAAALEVDTRRRVHGVVPSVLEPLGADWLLVVADDGGEPVLGLVDATDCEMTRLTGVDLTRRFADVRFGGVELAELARGAEAGAVLAALEADGALALCADSVGLAGAAFEMTIDYLKVREQFGQPLGSFQGLKHQAADLLVLLESARSALAFAVESRLDGNPTSARAALAVARRRCASAAFRITNAAIHLHGGIGFTWEHPVHLYHRRAKTNEVLLDPRGAQARVLADVVFGLYDHAGA
jgi:alkylation response protein AidB-like acyl-CoA dehydrogenase